jgi:type IV pilus assembly protein PilA
MSSRSTGFTLIELLLVVTIISIVAALAIPSIVQARKQAHEGSAIGSMRQILTAETMFRESDMEHDGNIDYGMLSELNNTQLLDSVLGSGTKAGYAFSVTYSFSSSDFLWFGTANPILAGQTGDRYFAINNSGTMFYTTGGNVVLDTNTCILPNGGMFPVGK